MPFLFIVKLIPLFSSLMVKKKLFFTSTYVLDIYKIQNTEFRIQNTEYRIQNTEYRIQNTEYGIQNTEYRIQHTEYGIQNTEYRIQRSIRNLFILPLCFIHLAGEQKQYNDNDKHRVGEKLLYSLKILDKFITVRNSFYLNNDIIIISRYKVDIITFFKDNIGDFLGEIV